jgi:23S rRNA pseudouridine1911/1915/1917 synthase
MKNNLNILFEDNHVIVVEKPFNILTQSDKTSDLSLFDQVKQYIKKTYHKPGNVYLGLLHRLDRPVRGIVVFAKTSKAAGRLSEQIRVGEFTKKYIAICINESEIKAETNRWQTITHYLLKNTQTNTSIVSNQPQIDFKKSILKYKILPQSILNQINIKSIFKLPKTTKLNNKLLIDINLITGRSHQIRAQLSHIGLPILGDIKYGANNFLPEKNIALVSYFLSFYHPISKNRITFTLKNR